MIQPVISRELTALVHRAMLGRDRVRLGVFGVLLLGAGMLLAHLGGGAAMGPTIFGYLAWILWFGCVLFGATATADTLSRERREGTLGLLFLTPLSAWDIVVGKLGGGATHAFYRLLTLTPMLTCSLLLGGITGLEILAVVGICLNTLFLALALGVFVSSTQTDDRAAFNLTFFGFFGVSLLPYGMDAVLPSWPMLTLNGESIYLLLSPAYAIKVLAFQSWLGRFIATSVVASAIGQHAMGWLLLLATAARCRQVALERPPSRLGALWERIRQWWLYGSARNRRRHRTKLLELDPIAWLALRHRRKKWYVWVMFVFLATFAGGLILFDSSAAGAVMIGYAYVSLAVVKSWLISETCNRIVDDRRSGALELILTTETSSLGWIRGQTIALKRLFVYPVLASAGIVLGTALWNPGDRFNPEHWFIFWVVLVVAVWDFPAVFWMCLWEGLSATSAHRASGRVTARVLLPAYVVALVSYLVLLLVQLNWQNQITTPNEMACWSYWLLTNIVIDTDIIRFARRQVRDQFLEIVAGGTAGEPLTPTEKIALKRPFAFGAWMVLWGRRHPIALVGLVALVVAMTFVGVRNALWDRRVAVARREMWLAKVDTNLPSTVVLGQANSPAMAERLTALATEARMLNSMFRSLHRFSDPYSPSNRPGVELFLKPFGKLADQIRDLPEEANFPWESWESFPVYGKNIPGGPVATATLLLRVRMQQAVEVGDSSEAIRLLTAICRVGRKWETAPSSWQASGYLDTDQPAFQAVEAINRWFNTATETRPNLTTISNLLVPFDSWEVVDRHLRRLPPVLEYAMEHPSVLRFVSVPALTQALDLVTPGRRMDAVMVFRATRQLVDALDLPETQRLEVLFANCQNATGPTGYTAAGYLFHLPCHSYMVRAELVGKVRCARAALMVEEFRRSNGRVPGSPSEIAAGGFGIWPQDPLTGKALEYHATPTGYRIQRQLTPLTDKKRPDAGRFEVRTIGP